MARLVKALFYLLMVRPVVLIMMGLNVRHRERLPQDAGVLAVNHNSHLDTLATASMVPIHDLMRLRPVGARDYFCRTPLCEWLSRTFLGLIPLNRKPKRGEDLFAECVDALAKGDLLVIFPEGSRGEPEERTHLKAGVGRLMERCPTAPLVTASRRNCLNCIGIDKSLTHHRKLLMNRMMDSIWDSDRTPAYTGMPASCFW